MARRQNQPKKFPVTAVILLAVNYFVNANARSALSWLTFGARVCDPQQRDLQGDLLRLTEPRSELGHYRRRHRPWKIAVRPLIAGKCGQGGQRVHRDTALWRRPAACPSSFRPDRHGPVRKMRSEK